MKAMNNSTLQFSDPVTTPVLIPVEHSATPVCINDPFWVNGASYGVTAMSFGSPYGAVIVENTDSVDIASVGAALGRHVLFPKGANIVFLQILNDSEVKARLWQRDAGEQPFLPEAACVAGTAAMMLQKVLQNCANVIMDGGVFHVRWDRGRGVTLTGPAHLLVA